MMRKYRKILIMTVVIIISAIVPAENSFAAVSSQSLHESFSPKGTYPDLGLLVAWNIDVSMTIDYYPTSQQYYTYHKMGGMVSMYPRATAAQGDGVIAGSITKYIDDNFVEERLLHTYDWEFQPYMTHPDRWVYWTGHATGPGNERFRFTAKEVGEFAFAHQSVAIMFDNTATYTLQVSAPN